MQNLRASDLGGGLLRPCVHLLFPQKLRRIPPQRCNTCLSMITLSLSLAFDQLEELNVMLTMVSYSSECRFNRDMDCTATFTRSGEVYACLYCLFSHNHPLLLALSYEGWSVQDCDECVKCSAYRWLEQSSSSQLHNSWAELPSVMKQPVCSTHPFSSHIRKEHCWHML